MEWQAIRGLRRRLGHFLRAFDGCFARSEGRAHLRGYVRGQLSDLQRKSVEPIADAAGIAPRTLQDFLAVHTWDHERATDRLQERVGERHFDADSVGLIDETGHPKSGGKTSGVQRQWCGARGKIDNCVVTVHLGYSTADSQFRCVLDGQLYLPESWAKDPERRKEAGIPESVAYRPKWQIALELIGRALGNGVRFGWLTFDEEYGKVPEFLHRLDGMGQRYLAEVPTSFRGWLVEPTVLQRGRYRGRGRPLRYPRLSAKSAPENSVDHLSRWSYPMRDQPWQTFHVKDGTKGPIVWQAKAARFRMKLPVPGQHGGTGRGTPSAPMWLIVVRNVLTHELKYFVSTAPAGTPLEELLRVAFSRWHIERCFQDEKGQLGLDHFECRRYVAIRRHLVITAISHLFLAETRLHLREAGEKRTHDPASATGDERLDHRHIHASVGSTGSSTPRVVLHPANAGPKPQGYPVTPASEIQEIAGTRN